jgi:hypothetical protein
MTHTEAEDRLRAALAELSGSTPLANPEPPAFVAPSERTGIDRVSSESATEETSLRPIATTQATARAAWLDARLLVVVCCVVLIVAGIFFVGRQLSHGPPSPTHTVRIPNFVGAGLPSVAPEARTYDLKLHFHFVTSSQPTAAVISQSPPAGRRIPAGGVVSLVISNGPTPPPAPGSTAVVPNVIGMTLSNAVGHLHAIGLTDSVADLQCPATTSEHVTGQSPSAGSVLAQDSRVQLSILCT